MPACVAATCTPPGRRARRSVQGGWTRRSPARSWKRSRRPGSPRPPPRSASSKISTRRGIAGQRLALERAQYEADRARRKFDACEPENRLVGRTLERALEEALANLERERGRLTALEHARPAALSDQERQALAGLARDLPRLWGAPTTTDRDRKRLLRTLIGEVIVTAHHDERRAAVEVCWEGGARTELSVRAQRPRTAAARPDRAGHAGADPAPGRAPVRPPDRRHPGPPRPAHRHRAAVHRGASTRRAQTSGHLGRATPRPARRDGHDRAGRHRARRVQTHDPPLDQQRAAARRADHRRRGLADLPHRRDPRALRARPSPTATCRSPTPRASSAAPARPCCTRSNAASCAPSTSPTASERASESRFSARRWTN